MFSRILLLLLMMANLHSICTSNINQSSEQQIKQDSKKRRVLIVRYSMSQNPMAENLKRFLTENGANVDIEEVISHDFDQSFSKRSKMSLHAALSIPCTTESPKHDASKYDVIILTFPIWSDTLCTPMQSFLINIKIDKAQKVYVFFKCRYHSDKHRENIDEFLRKLKIKAEDIIGISTEEANNGESEQKSERLAETIMSH